MKVPDRGDLVILDFDPQAGREQMKRRPALVLSPAIFNETFGLAFVAPITTKPKGHAFEVAIPDGLAVKGVILIQQMKSLDWRARHARIAAKLPGASVAIAVEILKDIIDS